MKKSAYRGTKTAKLDELQKQLANAVKSLILARNDYASRMREEDKGYLVHSVLGDGECGFTAFGITREAALKFLKLHIEDIKDIVGHVVCELLLDEEFYYYLRSEKYISDDITHAQIIESREVLLYNPKIIKAYIKYDVRDKKAENGWAHPATLQALAHIRNVSLFMWETDAEKNLIPHRQKKYSKYICPGSKDRVDILYENNNHYSRLEFFGFENGFPTENEDKICRVGGRKFRGNPTYEIRDPHIFIKEHARCFIYLTSVGQHYHSPAHFRSQMLYLKQVILGQIELAMSIDPELIKIMQPFQVIILIGDSLQSYTHSKKSGMTVPELNPDKRGQVSNVEKLDLISCINDGKHWYKSIEPILEEIKGSILEKCCGREDLVKFEVKYWSEEIDHYIEHDEDALSLMATIEDHLKQGISHICKQKNDTQSSQVHDAVRFFESKSLCLWDVRYLIEEGIGLYYKILPNLIEKMSDVDNKKCYLLYTASIDDIFRILRAIIEYSTGMKCPTTKHLPFNDTSPNNSNFSDKSLSKETKNSGKKAKDSLSADEIRQEKILADLTRTIETELRPDFIHYTTALRRKQKVTEDKLSRELKENDKQVDLIPAYTRHFNIMIENIHAVWKEMNVDKKINNDAQKRGMFIAMLIDTLISIQKLFPVEMNIFKRHYEDSKQYIRVVTLNLGWDTEDYYSSVIKCIGLYDEKKEEIGRMWAAISTLIWSSRKHKAHAKLVLQRLNSIHPTPKEMLKLLVDWYVENYMCWLSEKNDFNPAAYSACYFHCFENLMRYHEVDVSELCRNEKPTPNVVAPSISPVLSVGQFQHTPSATPIEINESLLESIITEEQAIVESVASSIDFSWNTYDLPENWMLQYTDIFKVYVVAKQKDKQSDKEAIQSVLKSCVDLLGKINHNANKLLASINSIGDVTEFFMKIYHFEEGKQDQIFERTRQTCVFIIIFIQQYYEKKRLKDQVIPRLQ